MASSVIHGSQGVTAIGKSSVSATISVSAGDMVVVFVAISPESVYLRVPGAGYQSTLVTGVTSPGLTFTQRWSYTADPGSGDGTIAYEYYAIAQASGTAVITASVTPTHASFAIWDMVAFSVAGVTDLAAPYDPFPTLARWDFNDCNLTSGCQIVYSTTNALDIILAFIGWQGGGSLATPPPGYTFIAQSPLPGNGWVGACAAYKVVSAVQNNVSSGSWTTVVASAVWVIDAIKAAPGVPVLIPTTVSVTGRQH